MVITEDGKLFPNVVDDKNLNYNDVIITDGHNDSVEITRLSFEVFSLEKLWSFCHNPNLTSTQRLGLT